jgi:hypothetical protein
VTKLTLYPLWKMETTAAAMPKVYKAGAELYNAVRSNWSGASRNTNVNSRRLDDGYGISIGTNRRAHLNAHLIEFGGAYHSPRAPTRRAVESQGAKVKWSNG